MVVKFLKDGKMTIITCVIFSFLCNNAYSQYNEKFKELLSSKTFCEGSITPYGILAPYVKRVEQKYIKVSLSFPEKVRVVFFVCVNFLGKAQEIHFIEASKYEDSYIIKYDSFLKNLLR